MSTLANSVPLVREKFSRLFTISEARNVRRVLFSGRLLVHKGSIALDGISLTVAEVAGDILAVWLIPHTIEVTNLREKRPGDLVNLEFDLLGKYVEKLLALRT